MKFTAGFVLLLLFLNTFLLFFQYQAYSTDIGSDGASITYEQEITLTLRGERFFITQRFFNLPDHDITISWPMQSENRACVVDETTSCERLTEDMKQFNKGVPNSQGLSYEIPITEALTSETLWKGMFIQLKNGEPSHTKIHLSDERKLGGLWLTGLPAIGRKSMDLIDYVYFDGKGVVEDLYFQPTYVPAVYKDDTVSIYSSKTISEEEKTQLESAEILASEHLAILETSFVPKVEQSKRILFVQPNDNQKLSSAILEGSVNNLFVFSAETTFTKDVVTSFLLNEPIGSTKSKEMYQQLNGYFTEQQKSNFTTLLQQLKHQPLSASLLDKKISEMLGQKTTFFATNEKIRDAVFPLVFEDSRKIFFNQLEQESMKTIFHNGRVLYSVEPLLSLMGYDARVGQNGYYVTNAARAFRFPLDEDFYVFNERKYDIFTQPIEQVGDEFFIEETWLMRLFLLEIEKQENRINIVPTAIFEE
ncbi:hypothetical protein [Paenisporosarcina cavernae]|uniref:RNA polymerase II n=1 Tax=Paenisporosarcina cavernae TaxID=2320858 RepID=A0A385YRY1_9BACL|nr:hypothetical protein [Paenisporosarcina cavernae]AYC29140.1 hypothetical protein D3873_04315 [Paenisporosarcina cavernae]